MGRGGQEGFVLFFPQVDNNLGKALKLGVAEEKVTHYLPIPTG